MNHEYGELENKIGYVFKEKQLLKQALTHSSYTNDHKQDKLMSNERLEFLGDAVLELSTSEYLYNEYPEYSEGELTRLRASIVCEQTMAACARDFGLSNYILLGRGEIASGGGERDSIISDAMEALIGSLYLDGGLTNAKDFVIKFVLNDIEGKQLFFDSKTILQEMVQGGHSEELTYQLIRECGPDHDKVFEVRAMIGQHVIGNGSGRTKKAAEQEAAYAAIKKMRQSSNPTE